jgi:putative oligomerization/nucleic acid binding protein
MLIGRRPLRHVALLGGTGFAAGVAKARRNRATRDARRAEEEAQQAAAERRLVTGLRELAALRDEGVLSPEEFQAAKRKLLSG